MDEAIASIDGFDLVRTNVFCYVLVLFSCFYGMYL
jgi:hypothetical protein